MSEQWKLIEDWTNYEVSNLGNIRRIDTRVLKTLTLADMGYLTVRLHKNNYSKLFYVHRLVLVSFVGESPVDWVCNHRNGIKTDNRLENLEWVTEKQNMKHAKEMGLMNFARGEQIGKARLTEADVRFIRTSKLGKISLARLLDVDESTIRAVRTGKTWRHVKD